MCTILIAEDNKNLRTNLNQFLTSEGYSVLLAENGLSAYVIAQEKVPDLIISDISMPIMNGYELLEKLRISPVTSKIPVIFITAQYELVFNPDAASGASALITKPFKLSDLLDQIESTRFSKSIINNQ